MKTLGLYIHIPFCESKCTYCDFNSGYQLEEDQYGKALLLELEIYAKTFSNHVVDTVFFGGGTPSLYSEKNLESIWKEIKKLYHLDQNYEATIECNPNSLTHEKLQGFKKVGFNRISLGAQSFDDQQLKDLTRLHSSSHIKEALKNIQKAQFKNFSFDLMYGLPDQDLNGFMNDLKTALTFYPPHFSFYNLTLPPTHPLFKRLSTNDLCATMHIEAEKILKEALYEHYEVSNYAREGFRCRHNLKYWLGHEYLGVGAGAASYIHPLLHPLPSRERRPFWIEKDAPYGVRFQNKKLPSLYVSSLLSGSYLAENIEYLTQKQAISDYLIGYLRLNKNLSLDALNRSYHIDFLSLYQKPIEKHHKLGLLDIKKNVLSLSAKGRLYLDEILIDFV